MKNLLMFINSFQVDFGRRTLLHALATKGRIGSKEYWVTTYLVTFSFDGKNFETVLDSLTKEPKVRTIMAQINSIA